MPSIESLMSTSRTYMRDHKRFFQSTVSRQDGSRTFQLPHPNVSPAGLYVTAVSGTTVYTGQPNGVATDAVFGYQLDERNGLLRLSSPITGGFPAGTYINVEGYYYTWVTDEDLVFFVENIIAEHQYHRPEFVLSAVVRRRGRHDLPRLGRRGAVVAADRVLPGHRHLHARGRLGAGDPALPPDGGPPLLAELGSSTSTSRRHRC